MRITLAFLLVALVFSAGCSSTPKPRLTRAQAREIDWSQRIGKYTYPDAIADLGAPAVLTQSGEGRTAEWVLKRSPQLSFGLGVGSSSYGPHVATGVGTGTYVTPPPSGEYLRLRFDSDDKLVEWSKVKY